jgi:hypothetical protein
VKFVDEAKLSPATSPTIEPYIAIATACVDLTRVLRSGVILKMQEVQHRCITMISSNVLNCDKKKFFVYVLKSELSKFSVEFQKVSDAFVSVLTQERPSNATMANVNNGFNASLPLMSSRLSVDNLKVFINLLQSILDCRHTETISLKRNGHFHESIIKLVESGKEVVPISRFVVIVLKSFFDTNSLDVDIIRSRNYQNKKTHIHDTDLALEFIEIPSKIIQMSFKIIQLDSLSLGRKPLKMLGEFSTLASHESAIRQSRQLLSQDINKLISDIKGLSESRIIDFCKKTLYLHD